MSVLKDIIASDMNTDIVTKEDIRVAALIMSAYDLGIELGISQGQVEDAEQFKKLEEMLDVWLLAKDGKL